MKRLVLQSWAQGIATLVGLLGMASFLVYRLVVKWS